MTAGLSAVLQLLGATAQLWSCPSITRKPVADIRINLDFSIHGPTIFFLKKNQIWMRWHVGVTWLCWERSDVCTAQCSLYSLSLWHFTRVEQLELWTFDWYFPLSVPWQPVPPVWVFRIDFSVWAAQAQPRPPSWESNDPARPHRPPDTGWLYRSERHNQHHHSPQLLGGGGHNWFGETSQTSPNIGIIFHVISNSQRAEKYSI